MGDDSVFCGMGGPASCVTRGCHFTSTKQNDSQAKQVVDWFVNEAGRCDDINTAIHKWGFAISMGRHSQYYRLRSILTKMFCSTFALVFLLSSASASRTSTKVCPILGPSFPRPASLNSDPAFRNAIQRLDDQLDAAISTGSVRDGTVSFNSSTFSIGVWSISDPELVFQRHHTDPSVANSSVGVRKVDADTVYRIGSNGKLLSVLTFLAQVGDKRLGDAVTDYIPELRAGNDSAGDAQGEDIPIPPTQWEDVTLGDVASQLSGLPRDCTLITADHNASRTAADVKL
jgi:CubicO group peptidase (beta-lactamase class C family)